MKQLQPLPLGERIWLAWMLPVLAYWLFLYIATRDASPMAFPIIFAAAVLVPVANTWVFLPKVRGRWRAVVLGSIVPVLAVIFLVLF